MTDLDTGPPRVRRTRPPGRDRPPITDAARARRAAARRSRADAGAAGRDRPPVAPLPAGGQAEGILPPAAPPSRARRVQVSLAGLDARAAARPFPDTSVGLDIFDAAETARPKQPLLVRLLRLRHVRPTGWQRAAVGDLPILIAVLLVLADLATAWTVLVLPAVVLGLVKFHDIIESRLAPVPVARPVDRPFGEAADS